MMGPDDPDGDDPDGGDTEGGDTEPDDDEPNGGSPVSLSHMTKSELIDYAESRGITGLDGLSKAQIISTLKGEA